MIFIPHYNCVLSLFNSQLNETVHISLQTKIYPASLSCSYMEITTFKNIYFCARSSNDAINNSDVQLVKF